MCIRDRRDPELPVIVISARTSTTDRIDLLKLGADDYLTKPFDLDELAARVGVQLRHHLLRGRQASVRDASPSGQGACGNESKKFFQLCDPFASTGRSNIHAQASERGHPHESIRVRTSAYKRQDRPHTGIRIQDVYKRQSATCKRRSSASRGATAKTRS